MDAQFESMDFAQKILHQQNQGSDPKTLAHQKELVDSGVISALDLAAPTKAVHEFNQASSLLRGQAFPRCNWAFAKSHRYLSQIRFRPQPPWDGLS
jgi:hypothetical protein